MRLNNPGDKLLKELWLVVAQYRITLNGRFRQVADCFATEPEARKYGVEVTDIHGKVLSISKYVLAEEPKP